MPLRALVVAVLSLSMLPCSGCVFRRWVTYSTAQPALQYSGASASLVVGAQDRREYVVSGQTEPHYVGQTRTTFGIPQHDFTESWAPLADDVGRSLALTYQIAGYQVSQAILAPTESPDAVLADLRQAPADLYLLVLIHEWMYDRYGGFTNQLSYRLAAQVFDAQGQLVGRAEVAAERQIERYSAFELEDVLGELLNDPAIAAAIGRGPPPPPPPPTEDAE